MKTYIAYYRVSTQQQGQSGLGLEAQRLAVAAYTSAHGASVVAEYIEVETGKGRDASQARPQLAAARAHCKRLGATLVIAKLDRLARNVAFIANLMEDGLDFVAADVPHADKVMLHIYAAMSEWERDRISERTKSALAAAKARGVKLGTPANLVPNIQARQTAADAYASKLAPVIRGLQAKGLSQRAMAAALTELGIKTPAGKTNWAQRQVALLLARIPA